MKDIEFFFQPLASVQEISKSVPKFECFMIHDELESTLVILFADFEFVILF